MKKAWKLKCMVFFLIFITVLLYLYIRHLRHPLTFTYIQNGMTNGEVEYIYMPDSWQYVGKYLYYMGRSEDGRPVYASDVDGTIIRKRKEWYSDMDYRALFRADRSYPDIFAADCVIKVFLPKKKSYIKLSQEGSRVFQTTYKQLLPGTSEITKPPKAIKAETITLVDTAKIENTNFPGLVFTANIEVRSIGNKLYMWEQGKGYVEIEPSSDLFNEIVSMPDTMRGD